MSSPSKMPLQQRLLTGLFSGLVYASLMAAFDYHSNLEFNLVKFVVSVLIFGLFMVIAHRWMAPKPKK